MPLKLVQYPNVKCQAHGVEPGYLVCVHVIAGALPKHHLEPTSVELGELDCGCAEDEPMVNPAELLRVACAHCARALRESSARRQLS